MGSFLFNFSRVSLRYWSFRALKDLRRWWLAYIFLSRFFPIFLVFYEERPLMVSSPTILIPLKFSPYSDFLGLSHFFVFGDLSLGFFFFITGLALNLLFFYTYNNLAALSRCLSVIGSLGESGGRLPRDFWLYYFCICFSVRRCFFMLSVIIEIIELGVSL